ncbi:MAG: S-methylmethionine-dependent homocysteine/selenocysteine methylase [Paracoccaceae bacterium]|jgi:S-methylmethionine-dependent homocysteine/selenocysteine methylase
MAKIALLDGGMGQELLGRSQDNPSPLWATQVMLDHPDLVREIHLDYYQSGATIATTNTYALHHDRLIPQGQDNLFLALYAHALGQASEARAAHASGRIAGSIGPLVVSYGANVVAPVEETAPKYAEIANLLAPHVDFLLIETMAGLLQAEGALKGASEAGLPVWVSFTVDDTDGTRLRSGENVVEIERLVETYRPAALLANCSLPEVMSQALDCLSKFDLPFGAYANGFTHIPDSFKIQGATAEHLTRRNDLNPEKYAQFAMDWVAQGATIVGGCCEVGPAHIRELAKCLGAHGHQIV